MILKGSIVLQPVVRLQRPQRTSASSPARSSSCGCSSCNCKSSAVRQIHDMDGTDLSDADNAGNSTALREPVCPDGSSPIDGYCQAGSVTPSGDAGDASGEVHFDTGSTISAHASPLGQALQKLAAALTGGTGAGS